MELKRFNIKNDPGFGDVWYTSAAHGTGDELTPAQAYGRVGIVRRPVDLLANAVQSIPYAIERGEDDVTENLAPLKFDKFRNLCATDAIIYGAYYLRPEYIGGVLTLTRFLPSTVQYTYAGGRLAYFSRSGAGGQQERYAPDELIYWWEDNFESEQGPGRSLLYAAMVDANLLNAGGKFALAWYLRGGSAFLLAVPQDTRDEELKKIDRWWSRASSGIRSFFKGIVVRAGIINPIQIGSDMKSAQNTETMQAAEERLAAAIGVPASLIFANAANYATAQQDERNLISYSAMPLAQRIFAPFNEIIYNPLGAELEFKPQQMPAFASTTWSKVDAVIKARDAGLVTTQYAQELLNLPETPQKITLPAASAPAPVDTPAPIPAQSFAAIADKSAWMRKALHSLERGKGARVAFTSDTIGASEHATIKAALAECATPEAVRAVFATPSAPVRDDEAVRELAAEIKAAREALAHEPPQINIYNSQPGV